MKILSVDDSATMRSIIRNTVELLGYGFFEANNGRAALETVAQDSEEIAMILLDWNMPEMDGITFLKTLKADDRFKHIPVTMVTTENERQNMIEAIRAGAKNYVTKPFTQENLVAKICECMGTGF